MKILNFGSCNIDHVYLVDHIVTKGETETSSRLDIFPGGKGLNQSIAISRAGSYVYHAGCIGKDGELLLSVLRDNGVNTDFLTTSDEKNGHAIIQVTRDGDNSIFLYPGSNECVSREQIDSVLACFCSQDILLLQNEINNIDYLVEKAREIGMSVILNPSPYNEKLLSLDFSKLSYIILNEVEAKDITGKNSSDGALNELSHRYADLGIMLTLGSKGCVFRDKNREVRHPAFSVSAVDTTAAGDTFTGYFVSGLAAGLPIEDILKTASAAAAISVTRRGAAPSIPTMEEVTELLPTLTKRQTDRKSSISRAISDYLNHNLSDAKLSLLSDILGYSPSHAGKVIRELTGATFTELLHAMRIERAEVLLRDTDLPISKIIEELGYSNESFFRRIFKEKLGKNPLEYRKTFQK